MTDPDTSGTTETGEAWRARLQEAGLARAIALFPDDVRVAAATAAQVRQAFEQLPALVRA